MGQYVIPFNTNNNLLTLPTDRFAATVLPSSISIWLQTKLLNLVMGKLPPELKPKHGILEANPTVRSDFLEKIQVGQMTPHRAGVEKFTENGLLLTNGKQLDVDVVIACTGYLVTTPSFFTTNYHG
jgi:dimethylaniline monooxygenase (N-oxide forming) / hypotaurine monooxygenase